MKEEIFQILEAESSLHFTEFTKLLVQLDREGQEILLDVLQEMQRTREQSLEVLEANLAMEIEQLSADLEDMGEEVSELHSSKSDDYWQGWEDGVDYVKYKGREV